MYVECVAGLRMIISTTRAKLAMIPDEVERLRWAAEKRTSSQLYKNAIRFFLYLRRAMKMFERLFEGKTRKMWNYVYFHGIVVSFVDKFVIGTSD